MTSEPDPYAVLGVAPTATAEEITAAYHRLIRELHPDTRAKPDTARLTEVVNAYRVLRDPERRAAHDRRRPRRTEATRIAVRNRGNAGGNDIGTDRSGRQPDIRFGPVRQHDE